MNKIHYIQVDNSLESPLKEHEYYHTNRGFLLFVNKEFRDDDGFPISNSKVKWWLKKVELPSEEEIHTAIKDAYRHGYASYEMIDAGLEPYDAEGYANWAMIKLKKTLNFL